MIKNTAVERGAPFVPGQPLTGFVTGEQGSGTSC